MCEIWKSSNLIGLDSPKWRGDRRCEASFNGMLGAIFSLKVCALNTVCGCAGRNV